jgi:beta-N-acetylhexosaminidase
MTSKIGCLIVDLQDKTLSSEEKEMLQHPLVGGIILFSRNYESKAQLNDLCQQVRATRNAPLLIMVDQEGGRVQRFINEFTRLPFMGVFGKMYDQDPENACRRAKECGWLMAIELLSCGIDLSLAPVLDLNKGVSTVIGERAFHAQPQVVIALATAFINGMRTAGMCATGKHFPGHGSVKVDSHLATPRDERSLQEIEQDDLLSFAGMIKAGLPAVMASHIVFPRIDSHPVGYSHLWINDILRNKLGFNGIVLTDDLNMEGANISANYADRVTAAREAGCDFALVCNNRKGVIEVLDNLRIESHQIDKEKWGVLKADFSAIHKQAYQKNSRWQETHNLLNQLSIN